jgi:hypothetical protein
VLASSWHGYGYTAQTVSELMAIHAPTRVLIVPLFSLYDILVIAFGLGVQRSRPRTPALWATGAFLIIYGAIGLVALWFSPMHLRGTARSATDALHVVATATIVVATLLFIAFGAVAGGKAFRLYSVATLTVLFVCGALAGMQGPRITANLPTPGLGILERVNIYGSLLWIAVLAVTLLRGEQRLADRV